MKKSNLKIKVVLADTDEELLRNIKENLQKKFGFLISGVALDGKEALSLIYQTRPDLIVLGVVLPEIDGFGVIEKIRDDEKFKNTRIVMCTYSPSDFTLYKANNLKVDYLFLKPMNMVVFSNRINEIMQASQDNAPIGAGFATFSQSKQDINSIVASYLNNLHIRPNISGYYYLRSAILMAVEDYRTIKSITKTIYPAIAEEYSSTQIRVERAMRHAIESGFKKADINVLEQVFGFSVNENKGRPTNSEFIALIADKIRIQTSIIE